MMMAIASSGDRGDVDVHTGYLDQDQSKANFVFLFVEIKKDCIDVGKGIKGRCFSADTSSLV